MKAQIFFELESGLIEELGMEAPNLALLLTSATREAERRGAVDSWLSEETLREEV